MSLFRNSWDWKRQPSRPQHSFEEWGAPLSIVQVPAGRPENFPLTAAKEERTDSGTVYTPTLIIGVGDTGHRVLKQWIGQLSQHASSAFSKVRVLTISMQPQQDEKQDLIEIRRLILADTLPKSAYIPPGQSNQSQQALSLFMEAATLRRFHEWLHGCLMTLQRNIQVFVLASATEPEIGLVGSILQILRLKPETSNPYSSLIVMLSLISADAASTLSPAESYASLREIGRLTYSGWHKMPEMPLLRETVVRSALIDYLFIFDDYQIGLSNNSVTMSFENGLGQSMAETLYLFCHPASRPVWEHVQNDASSLGSYRHEIHEPVVSAVGVQTLHIPLAAMEGFLAARLSQAVIFGDHPGDLREQLAPPADASPADSKTIERLARGWLIGDGPNSHPVFEWLWTIKSPQDMSMLPDVSYEFHDLYAARLSYNLVRFLNAPEEIDKLETAIQVIKIQEQHFSTLLDWIQQLPPDAETITSQQKLLDMLARWQKTAQYLVNSISEWQKILSNPRAGNLAGQANNEPENRYAQTDLSLLWSSKKYSDWSNSSSPSPRTQSLYRLLSAAKYRAGQTLLENLYGAARSSLAGDIKDPLGEVEKYYKDSVRPELSQHGIGIGDAYRWLRNRVMWWIRLEPGGETELLIVCWPAELAAEWNVPPPPSACYSAFDVERLSEAIMKLATVRLRGMSDNLTGVWFRGRLKKMASEIRNKAEEVFLDYDENTIVSLGWAESRRYYVIARDKGLTGEFGKVVFPERLPGQINELNGGDATRFSSMTIRVGIPFSAIRRVREWYTAYNHLERLHQYPQERLAARYENLARNRLGVRIKIPPEITMLLTDEQLVTLFCQSLYGGLIRRGYDDSQRTQKWILKSVADFPLLPLADDGIDGILSAFRSFTLELPHPVGVGQNPNAHFHPSRRKRFLASLHKEAKAIRQANLASLRSEFSRGLLADLKTRGEQDVVMRSFAYILEIEMEEPVWKGWWE